MILFLFKIKFSLKFLKSQEKLFEKSFSCGVRGNALQFALRNGGAPPTFLKE
jgi:hypothetical protein